MKPSGLILVGAVWLAGCAGAPVPSPSEPPVGTVTIVDDLAERKAALKRLQAIASAQPQPEPSASERTKMAKEYANRLRKRIRPFIIYPDADSLEDNPTAVVTVQLGSDGAVISALLTKASGNAKWDSTVLAAVRNASPLPVLSLPRDRQFTITFRPLE